MDEDAPDWSRGEHIFSLLDRVPLPTVATVMRLSPKYDGDGMNDTELAIISEDHDELERQLGGADRRTMVAAVLCATRLGKLDTLKWLLEMAPWADDTWICRRGYPVLLAVRSGSAPTVRYLLKRGCVYTNRAIWEADEAARDDMIALLNIHRDQLLLQ